MRSQAFSSRRFSAILLAALLAGCHAGSSTTTVNKVIVTISPISARLTTGASQQFTATVTGTKKTAVTWSAIYGTVSTTGLYSAPPVGSSVTQDTVIATSVDDIVDAAAAVISITPALGTPSVTLSPAGGTVAAFGTLQFSATVMNLSSSAVTWQVNGVTGGSQAAGYISSNGFFVAPGGVPTASNGTGGNVITTVAVTATSVANSFYAATANVTILPANQNSQSGPIELGASGGRLTDTVTDDQITTCCGGTLGSLLTLDNTQYILSASHVLARPGPITTRAGDPIIQPALIDVNCDTSRATTVANLSQIYNITTGQLPTVDAAMAQIVPGEVDTSGNILYLGDSVNVSNVPLAGAPHAGSGLAVTSSLIGREVAKSGRSTGLTCSTIDSVGVTATVQYVPNCDGTGIPVQVQFSGQIDVVGGQFAAEGDSGSLIVTQDTADPVALFFSASDTSSLGNPVSEVLNFLADSNGNRPAFVGGAPHEVIGCTLPSSSQAAIFAGTSSGATSSLSQALLLHAASVRDVYASTLVTQSAVTAVGVGASFDNPAEPAVLLFVPPGQSLANLPSQLDGVRTRIVSGDFASHHGAVSADESLALEKSAASLPSAYSISESEFARAKTVHAAHVAGLMIQTGIQGVGIASSLDSPGEAALMIFVIRGVPLGPIPAVIEGVRTRVRESSRFRAGYAANQRPRACALPPTKPGAALPDRH